jgi:hypothetical protein
LQLAAKAAHYTAVGLTVFAVIGVIETAHGLAILLDELPGVELGVDHHGLGRGVTEQRLNNVHGRVVVQMFGCKDAPAIVRQQHERRTVRAAGFRGDRDLADAGANGLNASSAGMANPWIKYGAGGRGRFSSRSQ